MLKISQKKTHPLELFVSVHELLRPTTLHSGDSRDVKEHNCDPCRRLDFSMYHADMTSPQVLAMIHGFVFQMDLKVKDVVILMR